MNMKFVLFLVAVCLAQSFEAKTVASPRSINDIIKNIEEIIKDLEDTVLELINQLPEILNTLKDKIQNIINSIDIEKIVESIQNQVDEILKKFGVDPSTVHVCVDNEEAAVKQLVEDLTQGLLDCKQDAETKISELEKEMEALKNEARQLIDDSLKTVKQCIDENGVNLVNVAKCLTSHLEIIKTDAEKLIQEIKNTITIAKEVAKQLPLDLAKCVAGVEGEALFKEIQIIQDFTKCVEAHKQEQ